MSRIGKQPIIIPEKTEVTISDGVVTVKGPRGELSRDFKKDINITINEDKTITLKPTKTTNFLKALWGTYASHLNNMISGVNKEYEKRLIIEGVGYKAEMSGNTLVLNVGFSHHVETDVPEGLTVTAQKNTITISGIDKELVGKFSASIRAMKKPEPYKGKGIRYDDEIIRRKQGKKTV